jgi:hypothetical protein
MSSRTPLESFLAAAAFGLAAQQASAVRAGSGPRLVIDTNVSASLRHAPRAGREANRKVSATRAVRTK